MCSTKEAKYTCPKCEVKTCCLNCLTIHKKELDCSGIRDKTKYIPIKKMTGMDYMSDYVFLEECTRYVDMRKRDPIKTFTAHNKALPPHLTALRNAAQQRSTTLRFLLPNFTRHKSNTSLFDRNSRKIFWRVEWFFVNAENGKTVDEKCDEEMIIADLLTPYFDPTEEKHAKSLEFYKSRGLAGVKVLLKSEQVKRCSDRYFEIDIRKSLKENLAKKTVIEFPAILVVFKELEREFDIIESDDEDKISTEKKSKNEQSKSSLKPEQGKKRPSANEYSNNFLFTDESFWESSGSSDDDAAGDKQKKPKLN